MNCGSPKYYIDVKNCTPYYANSKKLVRRQIQYSDFGILFDLLIILFLPILSHSAVDYYRSYKRLHGRQ